MMALTGFYQPRRRTIGLTALIDVVFILLMFFMLTSTFTRFKALDFQAPVAAAVADVKEPVLVVLASSGQLQVPEHKWVIASTDALTADAWRPIGTGRVVALLPEPAVSVQAIVAVLDRFKAIGVEGVTLGGIAPEVQRSGSQSHE